MCWSGEASAVLATIGLSSTAYFYYKKNLLPSVRPWDIFH
jgi:hypothetical protein